MPSPSKIRDLKESILNSYSQVFFSTNPVLAVILLIISFFDPTAGISGLLAVFAGIVLTNWIGIDKKSIKEGLYGFNNLLVGLGLGINFQLSYELLFIVIVSSVLTTFITFSCIGLLTKYNLPYLSLPFLLALWISLLATSKFSVLGLSVRDIYTQNEITEIGGLKLLQFFQSVDNLIPTVIAGYFKSLGAIFFQFNVLSGIFISIGLLIFSRIVFSLSILGYLMALIIYLIFGIDMESLNYSYIGFNYILSTIAIGAYFFQPSGSSYLASLSVLPMVILLAFAAEIILTPYKLCVYSLPFILIVYLFLYALRFRTHRSRYLNEVYIHQSTPEKNAYLQINQVNKIRSTGIQSISLPVIGQWFINQGYNGDITHQGDWRHGLDFVIVNEKNIEFQNKGDFPKDYYCFNKNVCAPSDGYVVEICDTIENNTIGQVDMFHNWGNTIVIKHKEGLCTQMSHLQKGSLMVKKGDYVHKGQIIAKVGNSGRSPYPHLHFQIQSGPYIGAPTMDYPLSNFIKSDGENISYAAHEVPKIKEYVHNVVPTPIIANAFNMLPGQELTFKIETGKSLDKALQKCNGTWTLLVNSDIYKNRYIECKRTGARAWFENDGQMFYFSNYQGSKETFLYYFMLSLFKVQFNYTPDILVKEEIPPNFVFSGLRLFRQDFVIPFYNFLKVNFSLKFKDIDDEMAPQSVELISRINAFDRKHAYISYQSQIIIETRGVQEILIKTGNSELRATSQTKKQDK